MDKRIADNLKKKLTYLLKKEDKYFQNGAYESGWETIVHRYNAEYIQKVLTNLNRSAEEMGRLLKSCNNLYGRIKNKTYLTQNE